jgi:hypothetical protein
MLSNEQVNAIHNAYANRKTDLHTTSTTLGLKTLKLSLLFPIKLKPCKVKERVIKLQQFRNLNH